MKENTLRELLIDELRDLYDAENRLVKALPKMAKAAESDELRSGIEHHLEQTKEHVKRIKEALGSLDGKTVAKKCEGMNGILKEGNEMLEEGYEGSLKDAAIISAAQRVEHYEIAAYGCVHAWATELGENEVAELLEKTLNEEKETDAKLTELAQTINESAVGPDGGSGKDEEDEEEDEEEAGGGKSRTANA
jgi:ferritin-like metal-binding protein YciE